MSSSKVAVVTGSNKGIGLAIVRALCKKFDGDVYVTSRNKERGLDAVKLLEDEGLKPKHHYLDVNCIESIKALRKEMELKYGGIDVLFNNAGIQFKNTEKIPLGEVAKATLRTNYFGMLNTCNQLVPIMRSGGRIVNISATYSLMELRKCSPSLKEFFRSDSLTEGELSQKMQDYICYARDGTLEENGFTDHVYGVSKLAVTVLTKILARRLREKGKNDILMNCCCPGWVRTDMTGPEAPLSPDQGAETPVYLGLLPPDVNEPHGKYLFNKRVKKW